MNEELEKLKEQVQRQEIEELRNAAPIVHSETISQNEDEYLDSWDVQKILGVCYNTLRQIVKQGLLRPIRINQRRDTLFKKSGSWLFEWELEMKTDQMLASDRFLIHE